MKKVLSVHKLYLQGHALYLPDLFICLIYNQESLSKKTSLSWWGVYLKNQSYETELFLLPLNIWISIWVLSHSSLQVEQWRFR